MMNKPSWTPQQQDAIDARNSSVMVSAAAGSGKTAILTERLVKLIADPTSGVRANRLIVVTFTNDAASELRKRLDRKLGEIITQNPKNSHLLKQQTLLQSAKISTINSFCFELLRDNITEQGITAGFSILDESDDKLIRAQSMDDLINFYSKNEYEKISYMYDKFCIRSDEALAQVIEEADRFLSSVAFRGKWVEKAIKEYRKPPFESIYFQKLNQKAMCSLKSALKLAEECVDMLDDIFVDTESKSAKKSYEQALDDKMRVEKSLELLAGGKVFDDNDIDFCTSFGRLITIRNKEEFDESLRERYKSLRKQMIDIVKDSVRIFTGFEQDFYECGKVTEILFEMLKKYQQLIWEKKCLKNAISFDDGERLVLDFLADFDENGNIRQSETALKISEFYDIIMIDEYQDSNNKQDMIFKLISKGFCTDTDGNSFYGSNAFIVGDVKQSIYKFRQANPKNFIATLKSSEPYSAESDNIRQSIFLNKNFRSSENVIAGINYIFETLMSESCGEVEYNENEKLYFGAKEYSLADCDSLTQISFINTDDSEDENISESDNPEAAYTAQKIKSMLDNQVQVVDKNGTLRPCRASDFCILLRVKRFAKEYEKELNLYGIKAKGEDETGYLSSREISVLLDLLRVVDNPLLDVSMAAVMLSPMFMFELEELAYLRSLDRERHLYSIISDVANRKKEECTDEFFIERCKRLIESLSEFRLYSITHNVSELISDIYDKTEFMYVMQLYSNGEKKRANLRALIQYAKSYENATAAEASGGLTGFIRYIDRIIENGNDFIQGKVSSSSGDYVSIKTIHKSKGLEYPFVFLAETSNKFKFDSSLLMCSEDGSIGYLLYDPKLVRRYKTSAYKLLTAENNRDTVSEEMRLFYVALTRAKQKLFINLKYNERRIKSLEKLLETYCLKNGDIRQLTENAKSIADWIWLMLLEHKCFAEIAEKLSISGNLPQAKNKDELFEFEFVENKPSTEITEAKTVKYVHPDLRIYSELKDILAYKYDTSLSETPAKLSVTQITSKFSSEEEFFDFKLKRPKFLEETTALTGSERGTAIHTFFQYCDFDNAAADPENEILNVIENGYLSENQALSINRDNVAAFFESSLFERIKSSDNVWRERKFMVALSDLSLDSDFSEKFKNSDGMIKGIVDLVFEENGKLVIVDYKSDRGTGEDKLLQRYKRQLMLYKFAIELTSDREVVELYLYSFELKKSIRIM